MIEINQTGPNFSVGLNLCLLNVSKKTMNPYQLMRKDQILDGLERFSQTIQQNVNIYETGLGGVEKPAETIQALVRWLC